MLRLIGNTLRVRPSPLGQDADLGECTHVM